jgi:hypothetical protein
MIAALLVGALAAPLAAGADVPNPYQPLAFLAGHCWKGTMPNGKQTDRHCFSWVYDGRFLRDQHVVHGDGQPDALGESIYFWNSADKQIEYLYIESQGGFSRGPVATDGAALVFPPTRYSENGETETYRSRWQPDGDKAYDVLTEFQVKDHWVTGFKVHMERVAAQ